MAEGPVFVALREVRTVPALLREMQPVSAVRPADATTTTDRSMTLQQLEDIELRLTLAETHEDVAGAVLQLVMRLREDVEQSPEQTLRQLLREAFEIINDADSTLDRRDWTREAKKWL